MRVNTNFTLIVDVQDEIDGVKTSFEYGFRSYKNTIKLYWFEVFAKYSRYENYAPEYHSLLYLSNSYTRNHYGGKNECKLPKIPGLKKLKSLNQVEVPDNVLDAAYNKLKRIKQ